MISMAMTFYFTLMVTCQENPDLGSLMLNGNYLHRIIVQHILEILLVLNVSMIMSVEAMKLAFRISSLQSIRLM